jgi:hypothetical protein
VRRTRQYACVSHRRQYIGTLAIAAVLLLPMMRPTEARPSARAVALATARTMSPRAIARYERSGHVETFGSYRITVPGSWEVTQPDDALSDWPEAGTSQLVIRRPNLPVPSCAAAPSRVVNDGVILFWPGAEAPESAALKRPLVTLRPRTTAPSQVFAVPGHPRYSW